MIRPNWWECYRKARGHYLRRIYLILFLLDPIECVIRIGKDGRVSLLLGPELGA